jgi:hypothetical protein
VDIIEQPFLFSWLGIIIQWIITLAFHHWISILEMEPNFQSNAKISNAKLKSKVSVYIAFKDDIQEIFTVFIDELDFISSNFSLGDNRGLFLKKFLMERFVYF